jgi:hypothetical protein
MHALTHHHGWWTGIPRPHRLDRTHSLFHNRPEAQDTARKGCQELPIRLGCQRANTETVISHFFILGVSHLIMFNPRRVVDD